MRTYARRFTFSGGTLLESALVATMVLGAGRGVLAGDASPAASSLQWYLVFVIGGPESIAADTVIREASVAQKRWQSSGLTAFVRVGRGGRVAWERPPERTIPPSVRAVGDSMGSRTGTFLIGSSEDRLVFSLKGQILGPHALDLLLRKHLGPPRVSPADPPLIESWISELEVGHPITGLELSCADGPSVEIPDGFVVLIHGPCTLCAAHRFEPAMRLIARIADQRGEEVTIVTSTPPGPEVAPLLGVDGASIRACWPTEEHLSLSDLEGTAGESPSLVVLQVHDGRVRLRVVLESGDRLQEALLGTSLREEVRRCAGAHPDAEEKPRDF